jgi:hypothetical protein
VTEVVVAAEIRYGWSGAKVSILIEAIIIRKTLDGPFGSDHARTFLDGNSSFRRAYFSTCLTPNMAPHDGSLPERFVSWNRVAI